MRAQDDAHQSGLAAATRPLPLVNLEAVRIPVTAPSVSSKAVVCDCRPFASALGPVASVGRQAALSVERDDDLAVGVALLDVGQRLRDTQAAAPEHHD